MMLPKLDTSLEQLRRAEHLALRRDTAAGFDGVTRQRIRRNPSPFLHRILRQLRAGNYHSSRLRPRRITTASGKRRRVLIPRKQDAIVSRVLLNRLVPLERKLPSSCICRTGNDPRNGIAEIAAARINLPWAFKADIKNAFDSIKVRDALKVLRQRGAPEKLVRAVDAMLRPSRPQAPGLPQGHPLAQLLLNVYLADVDIAMRHAGYQAWRYVDDYAVLGGSREEVTGARQLLRQLLNAKGLRLHPRKTVIVPPERDLNFLGWAIRSDGTYGPSPGAVERLQRELKGLPLGRLQQRIRGWEAHFKTSLASATTTPAPTATPLAKPTATASAAPPRRCT